MTKKEKEFFEKCMEDLENTPVEVLKEIYDRNVVDCKTTTDIYNTKIVFVSDNCVSEEWHKGSIPVILLP